jgi:hypothetical protein
LPAEPKLISFPDADNPPISPEIVDNFTPDLNSALFENVALPVSLIETLALFSSVPPAENVFVNILPLFMILPSLVIFEEFFIVSDSISSAFKFSKLPSLPLTSPFGALISLLELISPSTASVLCIEAFSPTSRSLPADKFFSADILSLTDKYPVKAVSPSIDNLTSPTAFPLIKAAFNS